jgi:hypothetical protein
MPILYRNLMDKFLYINLIINNTFSHPIII